MRCDLPRIPRTPAPCSALRKHPNRTRARFPHGLTARRVFRLVAHVLCAEEAAQPIKGCSSEIAARDSLRPRVVKANQSASGRGKFIADGARRRPRAGSRRHPANGRQSCDRASQLPGVLPLAISTQTDGLWVALERPFCVSGCSPTVLTPNVDDGHCQQLS
jgi:hypothetical protein